MPLALPAGRAPQPSIGSVGPCRPPSAWRSRSRGGRSRSPTSTRSSIPQTGFTKGAGDRLLHARSRPSLLPHLRDRHLTLKRYPNGVDGPVLLREAVPGAPARLGPDGRASGRAATGATSTTASPTTWRRSSGWPTSPTSSCTRRWRARRRRRRQPTMLAFDLDPGPPATIVECAEVALPAARGVRPLRPRRRSRRRRAPRACRSTCR